MIGIYFREHTVHLKLDSGLKGLIINIDLYCAVMFENLYSRNISLVQIHGLSDTHTPLTQQPALRTPVMLQNIDIFKILFSPSEEFTYW